MSTLTVPMMAPEDRVRVATAPSMVMRFSSPRLPLMLKPPVVRLSGWKALKAPPRTPGFSMARLMGLRPLIIRSWICLVSMVLETWPVFDCRGVASATTVTSSSTPPGTSTASTWTLAAASSLTAVRTYLRKPAS